MQRGLQADRLAGNMSHADVAGWRATLRMTPRRHDVDFVC